MSRRVVIMGCAAFAAASAAVLLRPESEADTLPWLEAECRESASMGGDQALIGVIEHDGMAIAFDLFARHAIRDAEDRSIRLGEGGRASHVDVTWRYVRGNPARYSPEYGGARSEALSRLGPDTGGVRVDMTSNDACHDPDRIWDHIRRQVYPHPHGS